MNSDSSLRDELLVAMRAWMDAFTNVRFDVTIQVFSSHELLRAHVTGRHSLLRSKDVEFQIFGGNGGNKLNKPSGECTPNARVISFSC